MPIAKLKSTQTAIFKYLDPFILFSIMFYHAKKTEAGCLGKPALYLLFGGN